MGVFIRPIETEYRGYRFRSRTEARYAVLWDAAGIAWRYEPQGFELSGVSYLPDFYLPELKTYVEVKPTMEAAIQAAPLLGALGQASGCDGLFAIDSPTVEPPANFYRCVESHVYRAAATQCPFCTRLRFDRLQACPCTGEVRVLQAPMCPAPRLIYALGEAQRARFEWGETGKPRPYVHPQATGQLHVYAAGAIFCEDSDYSDELDPWRTDIFDCDASELEAGAAAIGRLTYAGPTITLKHGDAYPGLAENCLTEVAEADALFAWIDREDTIGTSVEIGAAYAARKPIFIAFADGELAQHFYFTQQLATGAVITADAKAAWNLFVRWQNNS
jgi:hypothetical protein